ncbi:MAG: DUF1460 domain-containing protein, partial [Elusimicrobia bacterium]|nr:DUF1460 domain-containing protein [Elusimicrobiota bacterium]
MSNFRAAILVACLSVASAASAAGSYRFHEMSEGRVSAALSIIHKENADLSSRVAAVSEAFLGTTYRLGPLGEGQDGEFDKDPLYSFKKVDCTT